jgi:transcriptional regulator with XRE-family HTH domain
MTLTDYLARPGHTATQLASATGSAVSTITRAAKGSVLPSKDLMQKIFDVTGGLVTPNDFFGISAAPFVELDTAVQHDGAPGKIGDRSTPGTAEAA